MIEMGCVGCGEARAASIAVITNETAHFPLTYWLDKLNKQKPTPNGTQTRRFYIQQASHQQNSRVSSTSSKDEQIKRQQQTMQAEALLETLRLVTTEPNQRALSQRLGFSVGKTNYILKSLVEKGLLKIERFAHSQNKLNYRYVLTPKGISERISLTECFIERKQQEYQQLSQELESLKVSQQKNNQAG